MVILKTYLICELSAFSSLSKARVEPHLATWARPLEAIPPYSQTLQKTNLGFRHTFKFNILVGYYFGFLKLTKFSLECYDTHLGMEEEVLLQYFIVSNLDLQPACAPDMGGMQ